MPQQLSHHFDVQIAAQIGQHALQLGMTVCDLNSMPAVGHVKVCQGALICSSDAQLYLCQRALQQDITVCELSSIFVPGLLQRRLDVQCPLVHMQPAMLLIQISRQDQWPAQWHHLLTTAACHLVCKGITLQGTGPQAMQDDQVSRGCLTSPACPCFSLPAPLVECVHGLHTASASGGGLTTLQAATPLMDGLPAHLQRHLASSGLQGGVRHTIQRGAPGFLSLHAAVHCMVGREVAAAQLEACDWICVRYPFALLLCPPVLQRLPAVHLQPDTLLPPDDRLCTAVSGSPTLCSGGV